MAVVTVTGYTASKMQEIEQASIISGQIVGDNLVLKTKSNLSVTAGNVRGPKGDKGDPGGVFDATTSSNGGIRLAGNLTGTANAPTVTGALGSTVDVTAAKGTANVPGTGTVTNTIAEILLMIYATTKVANAAVPKSGRTTALWSGTQAEYDALAPATKNAEGFVAVIKP